MVLVCPKRSIGMNNALSNFGQMIIREAYVKMRNKIALNISCRLGQVEGETCSEICLAYKKVGVEQLEKEEYILK